MGSFPAVFGNNRFRRYFVAGSLLGSLLISQLSFLPFLLPKLAEAAVVTIDDTTSIAPNEHLVAGSQTVFTSDQTGYKFYVDSTGVCVYSKTTNGGASWNEAVVVDSQTDCESIAVWYDHWTPGDLGDHIHIVTMESASASDHLFYNRLDVTDDSLLAGSSPVDASVNSGQTGSFVAGTNIAAITKSVDGEIFLTIADASDSYIVYCASSCETGSSWQEAGQSPLDLSNDWSLLTPLQNGGVMIINRDTSLDDIRSSIWDGNSWSGWSVIDGSAAESSTYDVGMSVTQDPVSGDIFLVYAADHNNYTDQDHDIRTASYSNGNWNTKTSLISNDPVRGLQEVAVGLDLNTETLYVAYTMRPVAATNEAWVYYATSTLSLNSWGAEQGPVNAAAGNFYGLDLNVVNDERLYVSWYDPVSDDISGETLADLAPLTKISSYGTPAATINASTTDNYLGGMFRIQESQNTRNVTKIVITESGTIAADTALSNVRLFYDLDESAPYDCLDESYAGDEQQFGDSDTDGFSDSDGESAFTGSVSITATAAMCVYVVLDVLDAAVDGDTVALSISNPATDVLVTGGIEVIPATAVEFLSGTTVMNDLLRQTGFHWRNDNDSEANATSLTDGNENTELGAIQTGTVKRLRVGVVNAGSIAAPSSFFQLEYAAAAPTCETATNWSEIDETDSVWNIRDSNFITDGADTTDISVGSGGITNPADTVFKIDNNGLKDASAQISPLVLDSSEFLEMEFSIAASSSAVEGTTYCFRVTAGGGPLISYDNIPVAMVASDISVAAIGSQVSDLAIPSVSQYTGGAFVIVNNSATTTLNSVTITETGTVDAAAALKNVSLWYDSDTNLPYDCMDESYDGDESQFGTTDTDGFSGANGSSTFTDTVTLSAPASLCLYAVMDINENAQSGDTFELELAAGAADLEVGSGTISPLTAITLAGTTDLAGAEMEQIHYHWRNDDGNETAASSATSGNEDTAVTGHQTKTPIRLRVALANNGAATSAPLTLALEFGTKITTCEEVAIWTNVGALDDDWNMSDSIYLTDGDDSTNINKVDGGVSDPQDKDFLTNNEGIKDTAATTSPLTIGPNDFVELEYSITSTALSQYDTAYCFRVSNNGTALGDYSEYAEIRIADKRDFKVQRGDEMVSGTGLTLVAGVDYEAPKSTSSAFVRITNTHHTGAGRDTAGGSQNANDISAYITAAEDLTDSFTISRPSDAINNTKVSWEIIEFVGEPGTDNEMIVRDVGTVDLDESSLSGSGAIAAAADDADVVVYITGLQNQSPGRNAYYAQQVTSEWDSDSDRPIFTRDASGSAIVNVSFAVVEYTGINWSVQRVEHTYAAAGEVETEAIAPVNSLSRTFIHAQKRMGELENVDNFGHEVWLSSIGAVSFQLEPGAASPSGHVSVVWIIENMQTSTGRMAVQRSNGSVSGGIEPVSIGIAIFSPVEDVNNASLFVNSRAAGSNSTFPNPLSAAFMLSTTTYQLWRSEAGNTLTYRTEIVEWPVQGLAVRQNYYRFYENNGALVPTDPWPAGIADLGENTSITVNDAPPGENDQIRIRISLEVSNANLPAELNDLKLQYGQRITTCSAIAAWHDVGAPESTEIWRSYMIDGLTNGQSLSTNPPEEEDLVLSVSDSAGSYVDSSPSPVNPYPASPNTDVEYDWTLEHNGALERSVYCFRMVHSSGELLDGYLNYPQLRTAGFTPVTRAWRWYDDADSETPTDDLAAESVAPTEIANQNDIVLRVTVGEIKDVTGLDVKFKLQFDESPFFTNPRDVKPSSLCTATSTWCYSEDEHTDNSLISTALLSSSDTCVDGAGAGCGTHNYISESATGYDHAAGAAREYAFYIHPAAPRVGAVYYFRLFEVGNVDAVAPDDTYSYPSLVAESAGLSFSITGLPAGTTTAGIETDVASEPAAVSFGSIPLKSEYYAAHRISLTTNATEGYRILMFARQPLLNDYGTEIPSITGTNASPVSWINGCSGSATGCFGYHTTDATLWNGSTRFAAEDSFAGLETDPVEIMYNSLPSTDSHDIVYKIWVNEAQPAGIYETEIVYIAVPTY